MPNNKLKVFLSYAHEDNLNDKPYINHFRKHIAPLKENGLIEDWYDREIFGGDDFQKTINNRLEEADMILLFLSANFLASANCKKEEKRALELRTNRATRVFPVILSPCGWVDDVSIAKLLAFPTDGKLE